MAYEKTNWVDNETPINAANLNKMEDGIVEASKTGGVLDGTIVEWEEDEIPEGYEEVEKDIVNSKDITDKENKTYSANVIEGLILEKTDKAYFSWYEFKALSIPANSQANLIDAQQIKTTGKPIFISTSVTAMVASGNWSLYLYVDGVNRQRLLSADNHGTPLNYTNSTIITYIDEGTHTFEFRISCDGACTVPNYNQHSIVVCEI